MNQTSNEKVVQWLRTAIAAEKEALINYLDLAAQTKDTSGKNMFINLARDEFGHMNSLEKELAAVQSDQKWVPAGAEQSLIEKIVPSLKNTGHIFQGSQGDIKTNILIMARDGEKKALIFYEEMAQQMTDPSAQSLLKRLSRMEQAHYEILQAEIDYLNKTGFWMGFKEISLETT
ncbi:MAG: ferritin family protein [Planctomycetota bacterium]